MNNYKTIIGKANLNQLLKDRLSTLDAFTGTIKDHKPKNSSIKITLVKALDPTIKITPISQKGEKIGKFKVGEVFGVNKGFARFEVYVNKILEHTDKGGRWETKQAEYVWRYTKD